jgi:hypothetical protein
MSLGSVPIKITSNPENAPRFGLMIKFSNPRNQCHGHYFCHDRAIHER